MIKAAEMNGKFLHNTHWRVNPASGEKVSNIMIIHK